MLALNRVFLIVAFMCVACTPTLDTFDEDDGVTSTPGGGGATDGGQSIPSDDVNTEVGEQIALSNPLQCDSVMWCNSYRMESIDIQMPSTTGGTIENGYYQSAEGSTSLSAYAFENGRFSIIWADYLTAHGTYSVEDNDQLITTTNQACSRNGTFDYSSPSMTRYTYAMVGDSLYLKSACDNPFCEEDSARRFHKVSSLCNINSNLECADGNCSCQQIVESDIPPESSGPDECAP